MAAIQQPFSARDERGKNQSDPFQLYFLCNSQQNQLVSTILTASLTSLHLHAGQKCTLIHQHTAHCCVSQVA